MYEIQFRKYSLVDNGHPIRTNIFTLAEASLLRETNGDLVICSDTKRVVISDNWLWDWERAQPISKCYAKQAMRQQLHQNLLDLEVSELVKNDPKQAAEHHECWAWNPGWEDEALPSRCVMYDPQGHPDAPYAIPMAGAWAWFRHVRLMRFGHPHLPQTEESLLWQHLEFGVPMRHITYGYEELLRGKIPTWKLSIEQAQHREVYG